MRTKEMRGITLIALVITIVIIMILAGVTINLVVGNNNLFDKAKSTQKIQTVAGIKEALELEKVDIQVESKKVDLDTYLEQISTGKKNYNLSSKEKVDEKNAEIIVNDEYKFLVKDKENGDVEIIYDGIAKADDLTISSKNGTYTYPNSGTFEVTNNTSRGELTVSSDASNIATASIEGNTITVKPETVAGKANIIVRSSANGEYAENKVIHVATVKNGTIELEAIPYDGVYDGQAHNAFTSISTNPSDVKLEYSLDGNEYNEEMPTITNTSEFTVTVKASKEGYKTQITTETVKVSKAEGKLKLSATSGTITYPSNATFTVSGNTGTLSVSSNNNNIATASVSGNTVTVKSGTTAGKAIITVTSAEASNYNEKSATYTATVNNGTISLSATPYNGTYDGKAHNALTNVSANPSDAKIEYSINGGTYSTTMPTITNVSSFTVTVRASKAGYTTKVITETTKINKASGTLKLSATSGTSTNFNNVTFSVSGNTGSLSVSSSNSKFATASIRGNTVTVKPIMAGSATITVTSAATANYTAASATYKITINGAPFTASSGVGYYTDVNSDGVADGVIFVDLKNGASGTWEGQSYNYAAVSSTKSYKIVQKNYNGPFGTKDVLQPSGSGNKRFHVMALKDVDSNKYDFWGAQSKSGNGWTVPPWSAWAAFAAKMGLSMSGSGNYGQFKMSYIYWSSESFKGMFFDQNTYGCYVRFDGNGRAAFGDGVAESNWCYVRLQTTF